MTKTDRIAELLKEGGPRDEIAARVGRRRETVNVVARKIGIRIKPGKKSRPPLLSLMRALGDCDVLSRGSLVGKCRRRFKDVAQRVGCDVATVKLYAESTGVVENASD